MSKYDYPDRNQSVDPLHVVGFVWENDPWYNESPSSQFYAELV